MIKRIIQTKEVCWHCESEKHDTGDCPYRYRGGAVDGPYDEWQKRQNEKFKVG